MADVLSNLRNPYFRHKTLYVLFLPVGLMGVKSRGAVSDFAMKHWEKAPALAHRLYWAAKR